MVSGHGLIQERKIGVDENGEPYPVLNFEVSGDKIEAIHMLPGYTHNIINLSETGKSCDRDVGPMNLLIRNIRIPSLRVWSK